MSLPQEMLLPTSAPSVSLFSFPTLQERLGLIKPTTLIPPRSLISLLIPVLFWLLLEVVFYALVRLYLYPRINQVRRPPANPLSPRECFQRVVNVTLAVKDVYSFESFLQGWFKGADFADIKRDNVKVNKGLRDGEGNMR